MGRFVEGADRFQLSFLPDCLEDWVDENNAVHVIEAFVEALDLSALGVTSAIAKATGRPAYHPAVLLKLPHTPAKLFFVPRPRRRVCALLSG